MAETFIPLATLRWLRYRSDPPDSWGRLQQAFRRPGSDALVWRFVEVVYAEDDDRPTEIKPQHWLAPGDW